MYVHQINIQQHYERTQKQIEMNTIYVGTDCISTHLPCDCCARKNP